MAYFAELNGSNVVLRVIKIDNIKNMNPDGTENESIGLAYLRDDYGSDGTWKQCSYNTREGAHALGGTAFRGNFPGPGWSYDATNNIFHLPRPTDKDGDSCASWTMNTTTGVWSAPLSKPADPAKQDGVVQKVYQWDESVYQGNNSLGWVLVDSQ